MTPTQLECFISVESHLSFSRAAEDCHMAQTTVSRQISALEKELGCTLFLRDSHGVSVTPAGAMMAHYAPVLLEYQRSIAENVKNATVDELKQVRIGVGPYEHLLLRKPLRLLNQRYRDLTVEMKCYTYHVLMTRYRNKVLDMALCNDLCAAGMVNYSAHELCKVRWQVAAARDSDFWRLPQEDRQLLKGRTLITLVADEFDGVRKYCYDRFMGVSMRETNFLTTMLEMVQADMGVAILPPFVKDILPENVVMQEVFDIPYVQRFFAMFSPEIRPEREEMLTALLDEYAAELNC